jgi:hypothetical protein
MKIQFAAFLKNRLGEDVQERDLTNPEKMKKISLADLCCALLDMQMPDDASDPKGKVRRWELIQAITKAERDLAPLDLLDSDIEMLKDRFLKSAFSASVAGCAIKMLETPALELDDEKSNRMSRVK